MHIVQQTSSRLIVRSYPWLIWTTGVLFTVGGVTMSAMIGSQTLTCARGGSTLDTATDSVLGQCQLEQSVFWIKTTQSFALSDFQRAEVESYSNAKGRTSHRVVLLTKQESIPLADHFSSGITNHSQQASLINAFLQNPQQPTLRIEQNEAKWLLPFSIGASLALIVFQGRITTCQLDKLSGQFTLKCRGILQQKEIEHPLHYIQGMRILHSKSSQSSTTYQLNFVLTSGKLVPFEADYSSGYRNKESTAQTIRAFLGLE